MAALLTDRMEGPLATSSTITAKPWSITELTTRIRGLLEPALMNIWVVGEISNFRPAPSGHVYFSLKDASSCVSAALFGWGFRKKNVELKEGLKVLCRGRLSVYPPRGNYQLIVEQIEPLGVGALQVAFEQLKSKLVAEGLFDPALKRPLPTYPHRIVVLTSPTGAVIQDMLTILKRRASQVQVCVVPVLVQGEEAPAQLIQGLQLAHQLKLGEVIVLARGGGSIEDLWCFNHEGLARAIRSSPLPVVSAVGHEVDFTISDFVADVRAPTPSAAAEILTEHWVAALQQVQDLKKRMHFLMGQVLIQRKTLLSYVLPRLISPKDRLLEQAQKTDEWTLRLVRAMQIQTERKKTPFHHCLGQLDALSPLRVLERGYILARDPQGLLMKRVSQIHSGQKFQLLFFDGSCQVQVLESSS